MSTSPTPGSATNLEPLSIGEAARRVTQDTDLAAFYGETTKRFNQ